jgi:hypothetical protein
MDMMAHEVTISSWSPCTEKVQLSFHRMTYDHRDDHSHHRFCTTGTVHERTSFAVSTYPTRRYCKDLTSQCRYSCSIRTSLFHTTVCIIQSRQRSLRRSESLIRKQSHGLVFVPRPPLPGCLFRVSDRHVLQGALCRRWFLGQPLPLGLSAPYARVRSRRAWPGA